MTISSQERSSSSLGTGVALWSTLLFASVLSGTMLIPAVRPFLASRSGVAESAMHAFMTLNLLGGVIGAPLLARLAERYQGRTRWVAGLAFADGLLLLTCATAPSTAAVLVFRFLQGAANVGGLSILLGIRPGAGTGRDGRVYGAAGAAMMAGVAAGPPLGGALLAMGPAVPIVIGGLLQILAAAVVMTLPADQVATSRPRGALALLRTQRALRLPALLAFVERFGVGCFVVTFALHCHQARGLADVQIGRLFGWFLIPFVLTMYPAGRFGARVGRGPMVVAGLSAYGAAYLLLGLVSSAWLPGVLALAGVASSAVYSPALCFAATLAPPGARAVSMAMLNAAGALGMMFGTALAGILSASLKAAGLGTTSYSIVFALAGCAQLAVVLTHRRRLLTMRDLAPSTDVSSHTLQQVIT